MKLEDLTIAIYADGADINGMKDMYKKPFIKGFTTNPSLMKKAGVKSYTQFAKDAVNAIPDVPLSFEVFADDFDGMEREANILAEYGKNVYVKIPITNSKGESSVPLIERLSAQGQQLNITAVFTMQQVKDVLLALKPNSNNILSVFAGRIADTGSDPEPIMRETARRCHESNRAQSLWASCREVFNIVQADRCGVDIITVPNDILAKLNLFGKDHQIYSLETVQQFMRDGTSVAYTVE